MVDVPHRHCSHCRVCVGVLEGTEMKTVIEMAKEAGFEAKRGWGLRDFAPEDIFAASVNITREIERFAALVRADAIAEEREAQIREVDWTSLMRQGGLVTWGDAEELGDRVVATIRARGEASIRSNT